MKIEELSHLIIVRNHLDFLYKNNRNVVPKNLLREVEHKVLELDTIIFTETMNCDYGTKAQTTSKSILVENGTVTVTSNIVNVNSELEPEKENKRNIKIKTKNNNVSQQDPEVAARIAEEKEKLKRKKKAKSTEV